MKYIIGFILGAVVTALFFLNYLKDLQANAGTSTTMTSTEEVTPDDSFITFHKRFNNDSVFQMSRITFPLEGVPARDDNYVKGGTDFRWQKSEWLLHRPFNSMDGAFEQRFLPVGEDMMIENIKHSSGRYGMQRRFAKQKDGWYLIYYAAMNELAVEGVE